MSEIFDMQSRTVKGKVVPDDNLLVACVAPGSPVRMDIFDR